VPKGQAGGLGWLTAPWDGSWPGVAHAMRRLTAPGTGKQPVSGGKGFRSGPQKR